MMVKQLGKLPLEGGFRNQFLTTNPQSQPKPIVLASDGMFELPSRAVFDHAYGFAKESIPDENTYTEIDLFDCDDFSYIFKGLISKWYQENRPNQLPLAIGVCWGLFPGFGQNMIHSMNWVILDDGILHWIEPQFIASRTQSEAMRKSETSTDRVNLILV